MTNPIIGYENTLADAILTPSSERPASPAINVLNWQLFNFWQPTNDVMHTLDFDFTTPRTADYLGFYSNDLHTFTGATVEVYSGGTFPPTNLELSQAITTAGSKLLLWPPGGPAQFWRVQINITDALSPKLQVLTLGDRLELQRGIRPTFKPPALGNYARPTNTVSESGILLGRSNKIEPVPFNLRTDMLTSAWVRDNWPAYLAHAEQFPFFLLPEPDNYPDEAVYCWTNGEIMPPQYNQSTLLSVNFNLHAYR